jgi:hypothetical protein
VTFTLRRRGEREGRGVHFHFRLTPAATDNPWRSVDLGMSRTMRTTKRNGRTNGNDATSGRTLAILRHAGIAESVGSGEGDAAPKPARMQVRELKPGAGFTSLEVLVLRRYPRRLVSSPNYHGAVAAGCARDETGIVGLVLWGNQVDQVSTGNVVRIEGGWCRRSHGELVVSTGRHGQLTVLDS